MPFVQQPPDLHNQYDDDRVLRSILHRTLGDDVLGEVEPALREMGRVAAEELYPMSLAERTREPELTRWSGWGERIDRIELTPLWRRAARLAAEHGLVALPYERPFGSLSRVVQFALVYLFAPSSDVYSCPLAMTDGAARVLTDSGHRGLVDRAVPRLTSRDPDAAWTSGQWMTELTGGSDVGRSETVARRDGDGQWRLYGRKWFTSAATSEMTLTLARPEGNPAGGRGLALFYLETRDDEGRLRHIRLHRLKDKLGTRKVPTAELDLDGTPAEPVAGLDGGIRHIAPMLNITRTWNAVCSVAGMRRGLALARDYATKRIAFGEALARKPLHLDTLAGLQAELEAAVALTFHVVELLGRAECGAADAAERGLLRLLTPVMKLTTARQAIAAASETLEAFGGAGYVEDTGLPVLLRDAQVLSIWEGTTNVLSLDTLRALAEGSRLGDLLHAAHAWRESIRHPALAETAGRAVGALERAARWLDEAGRTDRAHVEAGARRFALTLGRATGLALLSRHAQWALDHEDDARPLAAAHRFSRQGIDLIADEPLDEARALALDDPVEV